MKTILCVVLMVCTTGLGQPILKDQNVTSVNLSQLDNFETPEDLWYELNNLLYWEVPLNIPDSYYEQVDLHDKISLRESLHKLIENHKVFPYTHPSLPAEANYRVDSWDIIALADAHPIYIDKVLDVYLNGTFDRQLKGTNVSLRYDTDSINLIVIHDDAWLSGHIAYMGLTSILLKWHKEDPVDDMERRRNTIVYLFQKNRNPFIDHPEWVEVLYDEKEISAASSIPVLWINEIHYDNEGEDIGEFVEIAGRAGINLSGWRLIASMVLMV